MNDGQQHQSRDDLLKQALAAHRGGNFQDAAKLYETLLDAASNDSAVLTLLGTLKGQIGAFDAALTLLTRSLALDPNQPLALNNCGNVLRVLGRLEEALGNYDKAVALKPDYAQAFCNKGIALQSLMRQAEAIASYDRAIALVPDFAEAHYNRGRALAEIGREMEALSCYDKAIALKPNYADAYHARLNVLRDVERHDEALGDYENLIRLDPARPYIAGDYLSLKLDLCIWNGFRESCGRLIAAVEGGAKASAPFEFLKILSAPELQRHCAEIYASDKYPPLPPLWRGERYAHDRIRVGYFSSDFRDHATSYLMAELFENYDRSRFEIFGFSFGPEIQDGMRTRLADAFEHLLDVGPLTDDAIARRVRDLEIDIAVDLKGYTRDARPGIFARRPAPIQVNYLGFPGTMGSPYIDYIIADHTLIPPHAVTAYSEKIAFLPHSYQANDSKRPIAERTPTRREAGLPEQGFVFCCFNNSFKITPDEFDIWMRLLHAVDNSVLWLLASNPTACANLSREAAARGVSPSRLVFAPKLPLSEHLARHRLADLFLDTFACNAHTTASDALWAGLPLLTCPGTTFAGRVAASLLNALGLPDLIASNRSDYEALALRLAGNPPSLRQSAIGSRKTA